MEDKKDASTDIATGTLDMLQPAIRYSLLLCCAPPELEKTIPISMEASKIKENTTQMYMDRHHRHVDDVDKFKKIASVS